MLSRTLLLSLVILTPALVAQEMGAPPPAKELAKLQPLVGEWEGSGKVQAEPGADMTPWTAKSTYEWGFGKHWLMEHTKISMDGMPALEFHSATGWDREGKRFIAIMGSNMGSVHQQEIDFVGDDKMLSVSSMIEGGKRIVETGVTLIGKDGFTFKAHRSVDGGEPQLFLEGSFKRTQGLKLTPTDASFPMPTKIPELQRLSGMQGNYKVTGKMIPAPGMGTVPISGKQSVMLVSGGTLMIFKVDGDPLPGTEFRYQSMGALTWDKKRNCYRFGFVSNMGEGGVIDGFYDEKTRRIVFTRAGTMMGKPYVVREVMQLDDSGSIKSSATDAMHGSAKPSRDFEAKFEKIQ